MRAKHGPEASQLNKLTCLSAEIGVPELHYTEALGAPKLPTLKERRPLLRHKVLYY